MGIIQLVYVCSVCHRRSILSAETFGASFRKIRNGRKMYILDYAAFKLAKNRERELIQQAATYRLIRKMKPENHPLHQVLLAAIGNALVVLGEKLLNAHSGASCR